MAATGNEKLLGALGLCRRAGKLAAGHDAVLEAAKSGRAALVLLTHDTAPGTAKKIRAACTCRIETIPYSQEDMTYLSQKPVGVLAVCDTNLAALCLGHLPGRKNEEEPV